MNKLKNNFIITPNLPKEKISSAIIGEGHGEITEELQRMGIKLYFSAVNNGIHSSAANHADMAAFYLGNGEIILEKSQMKLAKQLTAEGFTVGFTQDYSTGGYPGDVKVNCFVMQNKLYCKKNAVDKCILSRFDDIENVRQGYSKCSAFIVNKNSVITDDTCVYNALNKNGINVLMVDKGDIFLDSKHYGFIGGSGFMYDKNTAVFFGNLETHKSSNSIKSFLLNIGISAENLLNGQMRDIGGIIPLTGEINKINKGA